MNIIKKLAISGLVLSMAPFASADSISGSTDFRVTLPEVLVLYHWDDAHLILEDVTTTSDNDSDTDREISDSRDHIQTTDLAAGTYSITQNPIDPGSSVDANPFDNTIRVTLQDSWAVRSLSTANVTLTLKNKNADLKNVIDNNSIVQTSAPKLVSTGTGVTATNDTELSIPSGWAPVTGSIEFDLDLSNATSSGEYNTRGIAGKATITQEDADTFLLTLTGN